MAMCHAQLGDKLQANHYVEFAETWAPTGEEFNYIDRRTANLLRAEATIVISNATDAE